MIERVSVAQAKQRLGDLLGRVAYGKERVVITRRGRPMAVLMPIEHANKPGGLAAVKGWLDNDDPFFGVMEQIVEGRLSHRPRRIRSRRA